MNNRMLLKRVVDFMTDDQVNESLAKMQFKYQDQSWKYDPATCKLSRKDQTCDCPADQITGISASPPPEAATPEPEEKPSSEKPSFKSRR